MTSQERIKRMFEHREADRIPIADSPWSGTIRRWKQEGMPADSDWRDYFGVDKIEEIHADISPQYDRTVIEEGSNYRIVTTEWGVTMKEFKEEDSTPEFLDFKVDDANKWLEAKARMKPSPERIDWNYLKQNYARWQKEGSWVRAVFWFGFDVSHSWFVGTETMLIALLTEPEWAENMFSHFLNMCMAEFQMILDAGYKFDSIFWPDDMGYKNTQFFSAEVYNRLLKPYQKKAADWAHERGLKVHYHSCGDIMPRVQDLVEIGIDCLNPIEVKAGMDPFVLKQNFGDRMAFHGGFDAMNYNDRDKAMAEIEKLVPVMMEGGGYIFSSDHSIPSSVSLELAREIFNKVKTIGRY